MTRARITFDDNGSLGLCNIEADYMRIHGEMLVVYKGDELVAMFRESEIKAAYLTEKRV